MKRNTVFTATLQAAKTHRWLSLGTALCALSSVAVSLLPPLVLGHLIDRLTIGLPFPFYLALVYFGSLVLEGVLTAAQETTLELFGQKMTHALRTEMSKKLTHLPAATLAAQEPGAVAARFNGDVDAVEALFTSGVISMAADCCRIVSIFAVILRKNPGLALVLLVVLPLLAVFTRYVQKRMLSAQLENRKAVAAISAQVPEALHNIRTIHLLGLENYMERRYDKCIGQSYAAVEKTNFFDAVYSPVVLTINAVVVGVVMLLSASGSPAVIRLFGMSVGTAVAVINYISRIFAPIESFGMEIQTIQAAMAGVRRIDEFLAQPEREIPAETDVAPRGDVEFSHVTFGYDAQEILSDFSFTVQAGQQATLAGRTGAGKSTVVPGCCWGCTRPESGALPLAAYRYPASRTTGGGSASAAWNSISPGFQGSVLDQITLGDPLVSRRMPRRAARLAGLDEVIALLPQGYDTPCTEGLFSQGQWQLLSIARAVAADPGVLLLDEITANLDARTEERVLEALRRASTGRTVLSISHRTGAQTVLSSICKTVSK